jgi:hypothetical protein
MKPTALAIGLALLLLLAPGAPARAAAPLIPEDEAAATPAAGYGRAFGRIFLVENGKERSLSMWDSFRVRLRSLNSDEMQYVTIKDDGRVSWPLRPGEYVLQSLFYANSIVRLWGTFTVPEPGKIAYFGDLRVNVDRGRFNITFADEYAGAVARQEAGLREAGLEPVKSLLRPERVGSYKRLAPICATPVWGIECDRSVQGLAAVLPEGTAQGSPTTSSLTPQFEWVPAKLEKVSYDIAIYESFPLNLVGTLRERGKLVAYAEGLKEPKFEPATPLPAGKKYEWSVRLRRDDVVSTWTTIGTFAFFVLAWTSGSGQWYAFATPDK